MEMLKKRGKIKFLSFLLTVCLTMTVFPLAGGKVYAADESSADDQQSTVQSVTTQDVTAVEAKIIHSDNTTTDYSTLQGAITAVNNHETIQLQSDVASAVTVENKSGVSFLIDLNGKSINSDGTAVTISSGSVGFYGGTVASTGDGNAAITVASSGTLLDASSYSGSPGSQTVTFGARHTYTVTASVSPSSGLGGTLGLNINRAASITVSYGDSFTYSALPSDGYTLMSVQVNGSTAGSSASGTVTWVTQNTAVTANFERTGLFIMLDAGHYAGYNKGYAGTGYYEGTRMWKLHLYIIQALDAYPGVVVDQTRATNNTTWSTTIQASQRAAKAKGYDLLLSLHSNAASNKSTDYVVAIVSVKSTVSTISRGLGLSLAKKVRTTMGTSQSARTYTRTQSDGQDYYGINRVAASFNVPAIILEHSFHTNKYAATWLMSNSNLQKLAAAEAKAIASYYGVSTTGVMAAPKTPGKFNAYGTRYTSAKVKWSRAAGGSGYQIYRATSRYGTYTKVKTTTAYSYTNTGLVCGKTYYYKVRAYRKTASGTKYGSYTSVNAAKPRPAKPAGLKLYSGYRKVTLKWSPVSGATRYQVYRATSKSGKYKRVATVKSGKYTNKKLKKNKRYYYKIRAYRTSGDVRTYGDFCSVRSKVAK